MSAAPLVVRPNKYVETHSEFLRRIAQRYECDIDEEDVEKLRSIADEIENDMR